MSFAYKSNMRNLKVNSQHFLCFLHFVVDSDLHKFPEMSQVPSKQFSISSTSYRLHNTCSLLISTANVLCYKNEPHFLGASNNIFAIKVILQISPGSTKKVIYFYHHYYCFSKEIYGRKLCREGKFLNTNCICRQLQVISSKSLE